MEIVISLLAGLFAIASAIASLRKTFGGDTAVPSTERGTRTPITIRATIAVVALGWACGNLSHTLRPFCEIDGVHLEALATLVLLLVTTVWLAWQSRVTDRRNSTLQLRLLALWTSYVSGWSAAHGKLWDDLLVVGFGWWLGCSVVATAIAYFPLRSKQQTSEVESQ